MITDSPRVLALRVALSSTYVGNNDALNEILAELPTRGELVQVLLAAGDLLDELVGADRITAALAAELDDTL